MAELIRVFVSYSHQDEGYLAEDSLLGYLRGLEHEGVEFWWDRKISAGQLWDDEIRRRIEASQVALVLVSQWFLDSPYCRNQEIPKFLDRNLLILPLILSPCDWERHAWLRERQYLPRDGRNLEQHYRDRGDRKALYLEVRKQLHAEAEARRAARARARLTIAQPAAVPAAAGPRPGEGRVHKQTGMVLVYVPGGEYPMGADDLGDKPKPRHRARLSPFWIGKHPVTNEQFQKYLTAHSKVNQLRWNEPRLNQRRQPIVRVSWEDASAFCVWAGLELPSEAQWEAAARGPEGRKYPWGNAEPTVELAVYGQSFETGRAQLVGSRPKGEGPFGTLDQAGNVWEWCGDAWDEQAYAGREGGVVKEPFHEQENAVARVVRGGSWSDGPECLPAAFRVGYWAKIEVRNLGFRCVLVSCPRAVDN